MSLYLQFCQTSSSASPPHVIHGRDTKFKVSIGGGISRRGPFPLNQEERGRGAFGWMGDAREIDGKNRRREEKE